MVTDFNEQENGQGTRDEEEVSRREFFKQMGSISLSTGIGAAAAESSVASVRDSGETPKLKSVKGKKMNLVNDHQPPPD